MIHALPKTCLLAAGACLVASAASAASYTVTPISVAGATATEPVAIDGQGTVVGYWDDSNHQQHSFFYAKGAVTKIDPPGAISSSTLGIDRAGTIIGFYEDKAGIRHGYTYAAGTFTTVDLPGSPQTALNAINNKGEIVGSAVGPDNGAELFTDVNGTFTVVVPDTYNPVAVGVSKDGTIAGWYPKFPSYETAFRVNGTTVTTIPASTGAFFTAAFAINNKDVVVGQAAFTTGDQEGFIWNKNGKVKLLQVPGSNDSFLNGINDSGTVVGSFYNSSFIATAFVYDQGTFTPLTVQGSGVIETHALNLNNAGTVLGDYVDGTGIHGFVAVPSKK